MNKTILMLALMLGLSCTALADGTDPMPFCRKCPVKPPTVKVAAIVSTPKPFVASPSMSCHIDSNTGCKVCSTHNGPVIVCPGIKPPVAVDSL